MEQIVALHGYVVGFIIMGSWVLICLWALVLRVMGAEEAPVFWRVVAVAQGLLMFQLALGLLLLGRWAFGQGGLPGAGPFEHWFHILYGAIFPFAVLGFAHRWARTGKVNAYTAFAVVGLVNFGLVTRAWMVGAGVG